MSLKRSSILIANFKDGASTGWAFSVPEAFAEALDIRREFRLFNKKRYPVITQGESFRFALGDKIYDSEIVRRPNVTWCEALKEFRFMISITHATPALAYVDPETNEENEIKGLVEFALSRSLGDRVEPFMSFRTTQAEFVRFLQQGFMLVEHGQVSLWELYAEAFPERRGEAA